VRVSLILRSQCTLGERTVRSEHPLQPLREHGSSDRNFHSASTETAETDVQLTVIRDTEFGG
jgi:hypothetical protein